jgi:hypothetical protein
MLGSIVITLLIICAVLWSLLTFMANSMSDAPGMGFQGLWTIVAVWAVAAVAVLYKIYG